MPYLFVIVLERSSQKEAHTNTYIYTYLQPEHSTVYNLFAFNVSFKNKKKMLEALSLKI